MASEGGNDARRDGLTDAEGVPDGEDRLSDGKLCVLRQTDGRERPLGRDDAQKSEVRFRVRPHEAGLPVAFGVGSRHEKVLDAVDHVVVGEHESLFVEDDAASERLHVEFRRVVPVRTDFHAALGTHGASGQNGHDGGRSLSDGCGEVGRGGENGRRRNLGRKPAENQKEGEADGDGLGKE